MTVDGFVLFAALAVSLVGGLLALGGLERRSRRWLTIVTGQASEDAARTAATIRQDARITADAIERQLAALQAAAVRAFDGAPAPASRLDGTGDPVPFHPYRALIEAAAAREQLDADLVEAIVWQESAFHTIAYRYDPAGWCADRPPKPAWHDRVAERVSASYGLMQIRYPLAVERGFLGAPEELCVPEVGLVFGCAHVAYLTRWSEARPRLPHVPDTVLRSVLGAYHSGQAGQAPDLEPSGNRAYAGEVLAKLRTIQARPQPRRTEAP